MAPHMKHVRHVTAIATAKQNRILFVMKTMDCVSTAETEQQEITVKPAQPMWSVPLKAMKTWNYNQSWVITFIRQKQSKGLFFYLQVEPDCDVCVDEFWNMSQTGCEPCDCDTVGSSSMVCDQTTGQCTCKDTEGGTITGRQCNECIDNYYNLQETGCIGTV